jgi:acetyl-CoA hydrolase
MDFIYGAGMSNGGLPVIALPSTACLKDGSVISRITPMLKQGAGVVTSRNHIHCVATEFGMVDLYGRSIRERTHLLISIAHPDFREDLKKQAAALHYI